MENQKEIIIQNGVGNADLLNGTYEATSNIVGYDNTTLNPTEINVVDSVTEYNFTIAATGTLTLHISETGESSGTEIVGATFIRCDSEGNEYGSEITSNAQGNAVFSNVPYSDSENILVYYKQKNSDGNHNFSNALTSVSLSTSTLTVEIANTPASTKTIKVTDEYYTDLPLSQGTIILN